MSTASVTDAAWITNSFTWRNNRGTAMRAGRPISFGIPEPRGKETDDDMKGGDLIGFQEIFITSEMVGKTLAVFKNIEIKGHGDRLKKGQIRWHNFILEHGGMSEIWIERADGSINVVKEKMDAD